MPRLNIEAIEVESAKDRLRVVDLLQVKFPNPEGTKYWSKYAYLYDGKTYVPRVLNISAWSRTMNPETNEVEIELGNVDGEITRIFNTIEMELAEVTLIRYYPDLDDAIDPLWVGWGGTISLGEETATWKIHFGFRGFTQRGLRKIAANCWKLFADDLYCPYDGATIGECGALVSGISDTDTDLSTTPPEDYALNYYVDGDIVKIDNEQMYVETAAGTSLKVTRAYNNTIAVAHSAGTLVKHASCQKFTESCRKRRMHGPPEEEEGLRYFGGWENYLPDPFWQKGYMAVGVFNLRLPGMTAMTPNKTVRGRNIPVVYGEFKLSGIPAVYAVDALEFRHILYLICEGEVSSVAVNTIRVGDFSVDNCPGGYSAYPSEYDLFHNESCMIWWGGIGQRLSHAAWYNVDADQYEKNPYLINDEMTGDGPSLSDLFALRIRIQENENADEADFTAETPDLTVQFVGKKVRTIQGWIDDNPATTTDEPDPIEVAVDYLLNRKFGARIDKSRVDFDQALLMSQYCREMINSQDPSKVGEMAPRFLYAGALMEDQSVEAQLAFILQNCNGYYIPNGSKIQFGIRKAESLTEINARPWLRDRGTDRNILRTNGVSSLRIEQTAGTDGYVNQMDVSFNDSESGFQQSTIYIYDDVMQKFAADILASDVSRCINTKQLSLCGTTSLDQAIRLGTLALREEYLKRYKVTFQMTLKDSVAILPGDVMRLDSLRVQNDATRRLSYRVPYVRIWKIEETDKFTASVEAYKHDNDYYDN